jgi:hypothetical protein
MSAHPESFAKDIGRRDLLIAQLTRALHALWEAECNARRNFDSLEIQALEKAMNEAERVLTLAR